MSSSADDTPCGQEAEVAAEDGMAVITDRGGSTWGLVQRR
jgi:hypothetical protein